MSAVLYYLLKYPKTLESLRREIAEYEAQGKLDKVHVPTFSVTNEMPYFQAVIKEAMRLHPATGLPLWRVVPEGGATIAGRYFPAGEVVGVNTWVAHYNEDIFGADASSFRPERWLEAAKHGGDHLKNMDAYYFPVCILLSPEAENKKLTLLNSLDLDHEHVWGGTYRYSRCRNSFHNSSGTTTLSSHILTGNGIVKMDGLCVQQISS